MAKNRRQWTPPRGKVFGVSENIAKEGFDKPEPRLAHKGGRGLTDTYYYHERRKGSEDRRTNPDRRNKNIGVKVPDVRKKPAFSMTQKEFEKLAEPRPKTREKTPDGKIILKDRRREGSDRRK